MFPFHCNHCFRRQKYEISLELFVSRCGHILCNECLQENCYICGHPFSAVPINKNMPTPMAEYFSSPMKQYQHYKKVMRFHHEQEWRLVEHLCRSNADENKKVQREIDGYVQLNDSLKRHLEQEREKVRKLREYIAYYDRNLKQPRYMMPPISTQPRPRYPSRSRNVDNVPNNAANTNMIKRFTQPTHAKMVFSNSQTLSANNSTSVSTEESAAAKPEPTKKQRTPPPLMPFSQHKLLNPQYSFNSSI